MSTTDKEKVNIGRKPPLKKADDGKKPPMPKDGKMPPPPKDGKMPPPPKDGKMPPNGMKPPKDADVSKEKAGAGKLAQKAKGSIFQKGTKKV